MSGLLIRPSDEALGPCAHVADQTIHVYDLGYVNRPRRIKDLKFNGDGYAKGLRNGQETVDENFKDFVPWDPVSLKVRDKNGTRWIKYLSQKTETLSLALYVVDGGSEDSHCRKWFGSLDVSK